MGSGHVQCTVCLLMHRTGAPYINQYATWYVKVHTATRWTIRHGLMLLWFEN